MLELTQEQQQALRRATRGRLRVRDPHSGAVYVLVREDDFDRMQQVADGLTRGKWWQQPQDGSEPGGPGAISETLAQVFRDQGAWLQEFAGLDRSVAAPLAFQGRLNVDDVGHIQRYQDLLWIGKLVRFLFVVLAALLAGVSFLAMVLAGPAPVSFVGPIILLALFYLVFVLPRERVWSARRNYRYHEARYLETRVLLTPDSVILENAAHRLDQVWDLIGLVCDTPEGLMFCNAVNQCLFWLPQRLFEDNDLREQTLELVESKGVRVRRLS